MSGHQTKTRTPKKWWTKPSVVVNKERCFVSLRRQHKSTCKVVQQFLYSRILQIVKNQKGEQPPKHWKRVEKSRGGEGGKGRDAAGSLASPLSLPCKQLDDAHTALCIWHTVKTIITASTHPNQRRDATGAYDLIRSRCINVAFFSLFFPVKTERRGGGEKTVWQKKRGDDSIRMGVTKGGDVSTGFAPPSLSGTASSTLNRGKRPER